MSKKPKKYKGMATYYKTLTETINTFYKDFGEGIIKKQSLEISGEDVICITAPAPSIPGLAVGSSEQEFEEVGEEILEYGRVGTRPSNAP